MMKSAALILVIFFVFSQAQGAQESAKVPVTTLELEKPSKAKTIIRDVGLGAALGTFAGLSFIFISQGSLPSKNPSFDTESVLTGLTAGVLGGLALATWELKNNRRLSFSLTPGQHIKEQAHMSATYDF